MILSHTCGIRYIPWAVPLLVRTSIGYPGMTSQQAASSHRKFRCSATPFLWVIPARTSPRLGRATRAAGRPPFGAVWSYAIAHLGNSIGTILIMPSFAKQVARPTSHRNHCRASVAINTAGSTLTPRGGPLLLTSRGDRWRPTPPRCGSAHPRGGCRSGRNKSKSGAHATTWIDAKMYGPTMTLATIQ